MWLLYTLIAFAATLFGATTGMGGGVFIKPVLDFWGSQDAASVSFLSSATVFVMAALTLRKGRKTPDRPSSPVAVPLSAGAAAGGVLGQRLFSALVSGAPPAVVKIAQNGILIVLVVLIFLYMTRKERLPGFHLKGAVASMAVGLVLGLVSSFLGIGGGPLNVAAIMALFAFSAKTAMRCSLLTILFSQGAKLAATFIAGGVAGLDVSPLLPMVAGGAAGGFVGGALNGRLSETASGRLFMAAQIVIAGVCAANILQSL